MLLPAEKRIKPQLMVHFGWEKGMKNVELESKEHHDAKQEIDCFIHNALLQLKQEHKQEVNVRYAGSQVVLEF